MAAPDVRRTSCPQGRPLPLRDRPRRQSWPAWSWLRIIACTIMDQIFVVIIISALLMILAVPGLILVSKHEMLQQARTALEQ